MGCSILSFTIPVLIAYIYLNFPFVIHTPGDRSPDPQSPPAALLAGLHALTLVEIGECQAGLSFKEIAIQAIPITDHFLTLSSCSPIRDVKAPSSLCNVCAWTFGMGLATIGPPRWRIPRTGCLPTLSCPACSFFLLGFFSCRLCRSRRSCPRRSDAQLRYPSLPVGGEAGTKLSAG